MTDVQPMTGGKAPLHLWIVGLLSLAWNAMGSLDYFMTRTRGAAWIEQMMDGVDGQKFVAYLDSWPIWASFGWGLGVWLGLAGAILLLLRNRLAVPAFGVSLVGAVLGIGYQLLNPVDIPELTQGMGGAMNYIVLVLAVAQLVYARAQARHGRLR